MHKITKGLKKKKKGKKSKHKDEELFKPEELEAYRREHQQQPPPETAAVAPPPADSKASPAAGNDEWKKFNALTAGIDSFLKKTQDDLDRIKSTSFFQRVPPPSEAKKEEEQVETNVQTNREEVASVVEPGFIHVSESESEEEDEEDIFDTSYIDAIAAGEVKLAYIPESPVEEPEGDDPFDTAIAERAILGPAATRKGKKLLPLGAAVEVLTGRVQAPTCLPIKRPSTRRTIRKEKDLLLGSFDENSPGVVIIQQAHDEHKPISSLLDDDDGVFPIDQPIDLSKTLHQVVAPQVVEKEKNAILEEFDDITKNDDEDDQEFALLAAESVAKAPVVTIVPSQALSEGVEESWQAFGEEKPQSDDDPFDTTFAEKVVPGKFELKLIENEILSADNDFNPRAELVTSKVSIQITDPAGQKDTLERISEGELNAIQLEHRDLLGGSITDLSTLGDQPLKPKEQIDDNYIEYCDPFDTTIVANATAPGQTELKFLEKELLSDLNEYEDDDFDPRADDLPINRKPSTGSIKSVNFTLPIHQNPDLFAIGEESGKKVSKPLTPYYIRANSVPRQVEEEEQEDPFDTSFVAGEIVPGKAELKVIEKELCRPDLDNKSTISDDEFDPRDEKQVAVAKVVQTIKEISDPSFSVQEPKRHIDLLSAGNEVAAKVLTPTGSEEKVQEEIFYFDPFDTSSIASNILPGKTELKLLETELIHSNNIELKRVLTDPDFNPRDSNERVSNLLEHTAGGDNVNAKALTPISFDIGNGEEEDIIDPFDTSIANNIGPGQTELRLLESELI